MVLSLREASRKYVELSPSTPLFQTLRFHEKDLTPSLNLLQIRLILPPLGHILSCGWHSWPQFLKEKIGDSLDLDCLIGEILLFQLRRQLKFSITYIHTWLNATFYIGIKQKISIQTTKTKLAIPPPAHSLLNNHRHHDTLTTIDTDHYFHLLLPLPSS
jgi:hypothetical protein